jgi:hypothetical protein
MEQSPSWGAELLNSLPALTKPKVHYRALKGPPLAPIITKMGRPTLHDLAAFVLRGSTCPSAAQTWTHCFQSQYFDSKCHREPVAEMWKRKTVKHNFWRFHNTYKSPQHPLNINFAVRPNFTCNQKISLCHQLRRYSVGLRAGRSGF